MNFLAALRRVFTGGSEPSLDVPPGRKIVRNIVSRFAEGNVSLQDGQYITEGDVTKIKDEVLRHDFLNPGRKHPA